MTDQPMPCERCGQPHTRCSAHTRAGNPCGQRPMHDQRVCKMHGGTSPRALAAAAARREQREATLAAESFGLPREVDPHTALLEELHRTAGAVAWLGALVADLGQDDVVWGRARETHGAQGDEGAQVAVVKQSGTNAFVKLWQEERRHLMVVAKTCVDVGIEERRVRITEQTGQQLASVMRAVLDRLQLTDDQRVLALEVVPEEFRRMSETGGGA